MYSITHQGVGVEHVAILRDEDAGSEVRIAIGMGFNAFSFKVRTPIGFADILYAEEGFPKAGMRATSSGTPILVPFPNRIAGGKFTYDGKLYSLPLNDHGVNAIHGFAFDRPWRIIEEQTDETSARIVGEFEMLRDSEFTEEHWPGNFRVRCEMRLKELELIQRFEVKNLSKSKIPFGLGTHPYIRLPLVYEDIHDCDIEAHFKTKVVLKDTIPTGQTEPIEWSSYCNIGDRRLDDVFVASEPENGLNEYAVSDANVGFSHGLVHGSEIKFIVVYIPPHRRAICVEPYTCVTNALNMDAKFELYSRSKPEPFAKSTAYASRKAHPNAHGPLAS